MDTDNSDSIQSMGGKARAEALSPEERAGIAKKAAESRWGLEQAKHSGVLTIGDLSFPCSVLSDQTRILTQSDFMTGMGMYYSGWVAKNKSENLPADLPHFLQFESLKPYIEKHLGDLQSIVVKYRTEKGSVAHGIRAEIIPKICEVWMDADEQGKLGKRQKLIAQKAKILMRALAHVGIVALVDEATGYQEIRDKVALQKILEKFISTELIKWAKRFPDDFYKEMFRLKGWEWRRMKVKKPSVVGHYTNDIVYNRLAPGVLEELKRINPPVETGHRKHKHHQWLSPDVGHPKLRDHLSGVIALMKASTTWDGFKKMLDRAYPKVGDTMELDLPDDS